MRSLRTYAVAAAVAVLVALGAACALGARAYDTPFPGFLVYRSGGVSSLWRASWPGQRAGLRVRDVVVAVDGTPVEGGPAIARALAQHSEGSAISITVRRPSSWFWPGSGRTLRTLSVPVSRLGAWDLAYTFWLPFSIGILYLLLGALLYGLKPTSEAALASALCLLAAAFYLTMFDAHTSWRFARVWLAYPLLGPLSVHFFSRFPERRERFTRADVLLPLYLAAATVIGWREWAIDDPTRSDQGALISSIVLSLEFTLDLGLLGYTMLRGSSPATRNRAKSIFIGLGLTCGASVLWQFASRIGPPHLTMTADQAMVLSAMFPVLITYAIVTRDLFDIDAVLRASLSWGLASAFVLGLYAAAVVVLGNVAAHLAGHSNAIVVGSTLLAAILFHPVRLRAQRIVDRLWFRDPALQPELLALLSRLPGSNGAAQVAEAALGPLARVTFARGAMLLVRSAGEPPSFESAGRVGEGLGQVHALPAKGALEQALLERTRPRAVRDLPEEAARECGALGAEILVPLKGRSELIGIIAFAARRRGIYNYGLLGVLEACAPQLALALENAALLEGGVKRDRLAALGQLAAVIVHEVKNPLGIIKISAGRLRKRATDDAAAELAACVEDEVDRMDAVVRRLLELARPPAPALRRCELGPVIAETVERLRPELGAAHIEVETELERAPEVRADPDELRGALLNLLLNARDAMPGGGTLRVRLRPRRESGTSARGVEIEIEDTGSGMDEETRRQLFRPFFTTRHGGTGLGLAIVKRVIEDHHGTIRVESQPGEGSRFTLTLPE